jgi:predicted nucleic-acid-binding Zn-ribbon protein
MKVLKVQDNKFVMHTYTYFKYLNFEKQTISNYSHEIMFSWE